MTTKRIFITGIPAAGKSYLGKKLATVVQGLCVSVDEIREELKSHPDYAPWVNFYANKNEKEYFQTTDNKKRWDDLMRQSEVLWPAILKIIKGYESTNRPIIFEGVNILPHLAHRDLTFQGIVLAEKDKEVIFKRIQADPRWGLTPELQKIEVDAFFDGEQPRYKEEGLKYGFKIFENPDDAWKECLALLSS